MIMIIIIRLILMIITIIMIIMMIIMILITIIMIMIIIIVMITTIIIMKIMVKGRSSKREQKENGPSPSLVYPIVSVSHVSQSQLRIAVSDAFTIEFIDSFVVMKNK